MANEFKDPRCQVEDRHDFGSQPIEVLVGPSQIKFYVHQSLISRSPFFEKALQGEWKEKQERSVPLPEEDPDTFAAYLHWLYTKRIPCPPTKGTFEAGGGSYKKLAKMCALAEKLLDDQFMDRVLDALVAASRKNSVDGQGRIFPGVESVRIIYDSTPASSPARKLLVDMYVSQGNSGFAISEEQGTEFLVDCAKALLRHRPAMPDGTRLQNYGELENGSPCSYHKHAKDQPCGGR